MNEDMADPKLINRRAVLALLPISIATLDRYIRAGEFPAPIKFGRRGVRWFDHEVRAWLAARVAERDREQEERMRAVEEQQIRVAEERQRLRELSAAE
jgi:prophage regulatory protein